jgi:hypothetical protein
MITFADAETSGLIKKELALDHDGQPWIVRLAAEICDFNGKTVNFFHSNIRAEGRKIEDKAQQIHGVSSIDAGKDGDPQVVALGMLCSYARRSRYIVGYGIRGFDKRLVESLLIRMGKDTKLWTRPGLEFIDLIQPASHVCKIQSDHESGTYRWPSLDEICATLFGEEPRGDKHDTWDDVQRTKRVFFEMRKRGLVEIIV